MLDGTFFLLLGRVTRTKVKIHNARTNSIEYYPKYKFYSLVISPLSIIGAMYMLAAGSKGDTQSEILTKG